MAKILLSLPLFLLLLPSLAPSSAATTTTTTTVLDVFAAVSKTFPGGGMRQQQVESNYDDGVAPLSFRLHSRFALRRTWNSDYKALMFSRIARDLNRVQAIQTRVDLASLSITKSDLTPLGGGIFSMKRMEGPLTSGTSQGSGEYFCRVGIGNPPTLSYLVVDTGSDVNWIQCSPCSECYQQADPIFDPSLSSSFSRLTCETPQCQSLDVSECRDDTCLYEVSYGDGSYTVGDFATESITFGSGDKVENVAIGCGHNNEGLFAGAAGLLGLGGGPLSFPSQMNASSFSYCLVDRDSDAESTIDFNSAIPADAVTAPLVRNPKESTYYYVDLKGISVGGEMLPISPETFQLNDNGNGGIIVDSGTAITRLPTQAYNTMRDAYKSGTGDLPSANGVALFDTCYDLSSRKSVEVPTVSFHFAGGNELRLPAKNYMIPVDSAGTFCFAFAPTSSALGIIGNVQQQGTRVSYDLVNSLVGFSPNKC